MDNGGITKMNGNTAIDYRNPNVIRRLGIDILTRELGPIGMTYFIQQYDRGEGDYTKDRHAWLDDITMEEAVREIEALQNK
jgi:hypothetical protein